MTRRGGAGPSLNTHTRGDNARLAKTPWRSKPILAPKRATSNAMRQQRALAAMSPVERDTGISAEAWSEFHRRERERVLARYGVAS